MQDLVLSGITVIFSVAALVLFVKELRSKESKPYVWAWVIRLALVAIAFGTQLAAGAGYSLAMSAMQLLSCMVIIGLIWRLQPRLRRRKLHWVDWMALSSAGVGAVLWLVSGNPLLGLLGVMAADASATALGVYAAVKKGARESLAFWSCSLVSAGAMVVVATGDESAVVLLAPLFSCMNALVNIFTILIMRARTRSKTAPSPASASIV